MKPEVGKTYKLINITHPDLKDQVFTVISIESGGEPIIRFQTYKPEQTYFVSHDDWRKYAGSIPAEGDSVLQFKFLHT